jgi:hypothetical protein
MTEKASRPVFVHGGEPPQANAILNAVMDFARDRILRHADSSMLAQANQLPSDIMALLQ